MKRFFITLEANLWRRRFLHHLRRELRQRNFSERLAEDSAQTAQVIFDDHLADAPDRPGITVVAVNALILASYGELVGSGIDKLVSFDVVRASFRKCLSKPTGFLVGFAMSVSKDAIGLFYRFRLSRIFNSIFGKMFTFEDREYDDGIELRITRCGSYDFFASKGLPVLTQILCEWDHNWLAPIQYSRHDVKVERPITIATGGRHCEFHIKRSQDKKQNISDITIDRREDVREILEYKRNTVKTER